MLAKRDNGYVPRRLSRAPMDFALTPRSNVIEIAAEPASDSVALGGLLHSLWKRKFTVGGLAALGVALGIGLSQLETPEYRARTSVQLEGFNDNYFLKDVMPVSPMIANATAQNYLQNQVKVLESDTLARSVAGTLRAQGVARREKISERLLDDVGRLGLFGIQPVTNLAIRSRDVHNSLNIGTSLQSQVI